MTKVNNQREMISQNELLFKISMQLPRAALLGTAVGKRCNKLYLLIGTLEMRYLKWSKEFLCHSFVRVRERERGDIYNYFTYGL